MHPNSGATIRGDLNSVVEEAAGVDRWFIGHIVFPEFGVDKKSGTYVKLTKTTGELLKPGSTLREPKSSYGRILRAWESDTYDCQDRGLEEPIDDTEQKDLSRFFNAEAVAAKLTLRAVRLDHEIRVAALLMNTGSFAATAAAVNYTQALIATINFPADILAAVERVNDSGEIADTIVMSPNVFNRIRLSTLLQNFVRGNRPSDSTMAINAADIASAFSDAGIKQVLVGRARYDSAKKGQAYVAARVWGDTYVWVGALAGGDFTNGGAGRTIVWNAEGGLWVTETYREENIRSNIVRVRQNTVEKVIVAGAGTLITTSYS